MLASLTVLSFASTFFLLLFIPVQRVVRNIALQAIIIWLFTCSIIHGVNAVLWIGNTNIHIPVWCDIMTRVILAAHVGIPGSCLAIALDLERIASNRELWTFWKRPALFIFVTENLLCYVIPIIYVGFHFLVQTNRFIIVEDFGPFAAYDTSPVGLIVMAGPPITICLLTLVVTGLIIHYTNRNPATSFSEHVTRRRASMNTKLLTRRMLIIGFMAAIMLVFNVYSFMMISSFDSWTSVAEVRKLSTKIEVVKGNNSTRTMLISWWMITIITVVFLVLSFVIGDEVRDMVEWVYGRYIAFKEWTQKRNKPLLPQSVQDSETTQSESDDTILQDEWLSTDSLTRQKAPNPVLSNSHATSSEFSQFSIDIVLPVIKPLRIIRSTRPAAVLASKPAQQEYSRELVDTQAADYVPDLTPRPSLWSLPSMLVESYEPESSRPPIPCLTALPTAHVSDSPHRQIIPEDAVSIISTVLEKLPIWPLRRMSAPYVMEYVPRSSRLFVPMTRAEVHSMNFNDTYTQWVPRHSRRAPKRDIYGTP